MADPLSTRFSQRNLANTAFVESFVSGSNIVYGTDAQGLVTALTEVPYAISSAFATSASYAITASHALNAGTLLITGSTYEITSSWAITSSYSIYSVFSETSSYSISASHSETSSYSISSSYSVSASYAESASYALSSSYADSLNPAGDYELNNLTASNILVKQNLWVSGSIYASVFSSSNIYITSSHLVVTDNIITLNALTPYIRYAGFEMYDSGSGTLSSLLWDSENNYFFVSSSDAGYARQVILGPDLEKSLIPGYIALISSSNSITSSIMHQDGNTIIVDGNISASVFSSSVNPGVGFYGTASYALNAKSGLPPGGDESFLLSKKTNADYDVEWVQNPALIFTASYFSRPILPDPPMASAITCSSQYGFWHLHTNNDLNIYISASSQQTSFTIRLVSSGSVPNRVSLSPYNSIEWVGTAGFGSSSIEQLGTIEMMSGQEILLTFVYYNIPSAQYPEKKFAGIVTDLNTPGLETKTVVSNLYVIGEGDIGINGDQLNNPNAFIGSLCGGGIGPDNTGPTSKTFWGWVPIYIEGFGRKYFPLYQ